MSHINNLVGVVRGLRMVLEAGVKFQQENINMKWNNSSFKSILHICSTNNFIAYKPNLDTKDILDKAFVLGHGYKQYAAMNIPNFRTDLENKADMDSQVKEEYEELNREFNKVLEVLVKEDKLKKSSRLPTMNEQFEAPLEDLKSSQTATPQQSSMSRQVASSSTPVNETNVPKVVAKKKVRVSLSDNSKARVVPSSRIGRMISFGSLAAGLGVGTVAQYARNTLQNVTGRAETDELSNTFMSTANAERIVDTLCKVRGAALKLGQLLSIQDDTVISPHLQKIFERVRQSADFMPSWQVEKVLSSQLGAEWRNRIQSFEEKPFAAASIGK